MSWDTPRHGWGYRSPLEVLGRAAAVHVVTVLSYIHLQRTQKVEYVTRTARVLRIVLFAFMPTLVVAELILNFGRTFFLFLLSDSSKLTLRVGLNNWKRYLCGLAGMHVAPKPELEQDEDEEERGQADTTSNDTGIEQSETPTTVSANVLPGLAKIKDSDDLEHHKQRWSLWLVGRITLLILPILQGAGTIVLWERRVDHGWWNAPIGLDKRNFVAATASIYCSILSIVILSCRSEWSLKTLNSHKSDQGNLLPSNFFWEIIIASILNEGPYISMWNVIPFSWTEAILLPLTSTGLFFLVCLVLLIWLLIWAYDDRLRQRNIIINWHFVVGLPVAVFTLWIFIDLISYFVNDIVQFATAEKQDEYWDKDPWANYLPIC